MPPGAVVDTSGPVEIAPGVFWVGVADHPMGLQCNPYLLVDGDEGVIMDPGSVLDFDLVRLQVEKVLPVSQLSHIVLSHQDPDLCSSTPLFERAGFRGKIATHWRASVLQRYYGIRSGFYLVNENGWQLTLRSGRVLRFIHTPYLHFPGAIATYDPTTRVLFSQDLFGAFSLNWTFYADKATYLEAMAAFHEHYMPGNDNLRPVMELFGQMDISMIAPQHGSVIDADVREYIVTLRDLECGSMLRPIKKELAETGGYTAVCDDVLRRLASVFDPADVRGAFDGSDIVLAPDRMVIADYSTTGFELWNHLFDVICTARGQGWLTVTEPLVERLVEEYDIPLPRIFASARMEAERKLLTMSQENLALRELNKRLDKTLRSTQDRLTRCQVTKLHNERFFVSYLEQTIPSYLAEPEQLAILFVGLDRFDETAFEFGKETGDEVLRAAAHVLESAKAETDQLFRLDGPSMALLLPKAGTPDEVAALADHVRNEVGASALFIRPVTASIGVAFLSDLPSLEEAPTALATSLVNLTRMRMRIARNRGGNRVCMESEAVGYSEAAGSILVVDPDPVTRDVLRVSLEGMRYTVEQSADGEDALRRIVAHPPDLVIAEAMLPKVDGYALRERMLESSTLQGIPYLLVSHARDPESVARAQALGIDHFFRKPYLLSELVGTVRLKLQA